MELYILNILILEDNLEQAQLLGNIVKNTYNTSAVYFADNILSAQELVGQYDFDLFMLDIVIDTDNILNNNGMDFALSIRKLKQYSHTPIVFITSYPEHMQTAINDTHCYSFIIKPYTTETVTKTLMEVSDYYDYDSSFLKIRDYTGIIFKIRIRDILYIESCGHRITFHTEHSNYDTGEYTLEKIVEQLPEFFVRCHRKYIININKATSYDRTNRYIHINNNIVPVGRTYKTVFEERWRE